MIKVIRIAIISAITIGIAVSLYLRLTGRLSIPEIIIYIKSSQGVTPYFLALLYLISPTLFLPTFYLTLLVGMLWGPIWGLIIDILGSTAGSTITFLVARYGAREFIREKLLDKRLGKLFEQGGNVGWKLNAFLRLNPIFPSAAIAYFFGLSTIGISEFILSTALFLVLPCAVFVSIGSSAGDILLQNNFQSIFISSSFLLVSLVTWGLFYQHNIKKKAKP